MIQLVLGWERKPLATRRKSCGFLSLPAHRSAYFQNETILLTRKWQTPRSGVDSGENHVFRQKNTFEISQFQRYSSQDAGKADATESYLIAAE